MELAYTKLKRKIRSPLNILDMFEVPKIYCYFRLKNENGP